MVIASAITPPFAPALYLFLLLLEEAWLSPGSPGSTGDQMWVPFLVVGTPIAYLNAGVVVLVVYLIAGRRGLTRPWLLLCFGSLAGTVTMIALMQSRFEWQFVVPGTLAGFTSALIFWRIGLKGLNPSNAS